MAANTTIRNDALKCLNCGGEAKLSFPMAIPDLTQKIEAFNREHANCEATWREPKPEPGWGINKRAHFWSQYGERGASSITIYRTMLNPDPNNPVAETAYPYDAGDFKRCHGLLEMVPEWRSQLHKLAIISPQWARLAEAWPELTRLFEAQEWRTFNHLLTLTLAGPAK